MAESGVCERSQEEEWKGGGEKRVGAVRRKSEEEVYTLLFKEVDSEGRGEVAVESLVDYLHQIQLGSAQSQQEDVYDSHEDVSVILPLTAVALYSPFPYRCTWSDTTCSY